MSITCSVCPHNCVLNYKQIGRCGVYQNTGLSIGNILDQKLSVLTVAPIEKRPLFHFFPGSKFLSAGFYGCSFNCLYCANFSVSQTTVGPFKIFTSQQLVEEAVKRSLAGIAFSYNEPLLYSDYVLEVGKLAQQFGLHVVVKSNGFINLEVLKKLQPFVQAFNIDIKGDDEEYHRIMGGWLEPVIQSIDYLSKSSSHLEISYLILPRLIDNFKYHQDMRDLLAVYNVNIPIHLLYYYPFHKMTDTPYDIESLVIVKEFFEQKMKYVYISNWYGEHSERFRNTYCNICGSTMICRKRGMQINSIECCEGRLPGIFV